MENIALHTYRRTLSAFTDLTVDGKLPPAGEPHFPGSPDPGIRYRRMVCDECDRLLRDLRTCTMEYSALQRDLFARVRMGEVASDSRIAAVEKVAQAAKVALRSLTDHRKAHVPLERAG